MEVTCPECNGGFDFRLAFDAAFCWAGIPPAIAFKYPRCANPIYFGPREAETEVGFIGAGPPIDPVPMTRYPFRVGVLRESHQLTIEFDGRRRTIPSAAAYVTGGEQ